MEKAFFDSSINAVSIVFAGQPSLSEFKAKTNYIIDLLEKHNTNKVLNDTSGLIANSVENQEWAENVWFPNAIKSGLKYFAFVKSADLIGQVSAEQTNEKAEESGDVEIKYFDEILEAKEWLKSK